MTRLIPLFSLVFSFVSPEAWTNSLTPTKRATDLKKVVYLDQLEEFQPLKSSRAVLFIRDSVIPSQWEAHFRKASRRAAHAPVIRLDTGTAELLEGCRVGSLVEPPCLEGLSREAGRASMALLFRDFRRDTTLEARMKPVNTSMMVNGKMVNQVQWVQIPLAPLHHQAVEVILIDLDSRRTHYHARLVESGSSPAQANAELGKQIAKKLEKVFRPGVGTDFPRRVLAVNPLAAASVTGDFLAFQASFEKLLGTGKRSLVWDPVFFSYENEDRGLDYFYLPLLGIRQYFRTEGRGFFLHAKGGYLYQSDLGELSGMAIGQDTPERTHLLALMAGPGLSIAIMRVRLQASLALGTGFGMIRTWTTDWFGEPLEYSDYGFGMRPVVNASLGVGWSF